MTNLVWVSYTYIKTNNQEKKQKNTTVILFVDLEKAFDNVNWNMKLLQKTIIGSRGWKIIHSLYKNKWCGEIKEEAIILNGVHQGCFLTIYLFNLFAQKEIYKIREYQKLE